jgi:hypothetical protein
MSKPSGADTAVRGIVMLLVLGGGAWGAMQYPPVADRVTALWRAWEAGKPLLSSNDSLSEARNAGGDAPPFSPGGAEAPNNVSGTADHRDHAAHGAPMVPGAGSSATVSAADSRLLPGDGTRSVPATLEAGVPPAHLAADESLQPLPAPRRPLPENLRSTEPPSLYGAQPVEFQRDTPGGAPGAVSPDSSTSPAQSTADLDAQLRRLGATYCLLERWEESPPRYRFHCRVHLAPGAEPRRFEAVGSDPLRLMREVADAVAATRSQRP